MFTRIIKIKYKNKYYDVLLFFKEDSEDGISTVEIRSMHSEYFLIEEITFDNRDAAYSFIKFCQNEFAKEFFIRAAQANVEGFN